MKERRQTKILSYFQHIQRRDRNEFSRKGTILFHALVRTESYIKSLFSLCNNQWSALRPRRQLPVRKRSP
jgi:hypothetical protein